MEELNLKIQPKLYRLLVDGSKKEKMTLNLYVDMLIRLGIKTEKMVQSKVDEQKL